MARVSHLGPWLQRKRPLDEFINIERNPPNREWGGFLALDVVHPVHEAVGLPAESLSSSWTAIHHYVSSACRLIRSRTPSWLDSEEAAEIIEKLGQPPTLCYPLYLLAIANSDEQRVVYVGKTSTDHGRFRGGHAALTKLHHPRYDGFAKRIYLGAIVLMTDGKDYQPLEWVHPLAKAREILSSVEAQLIHDLKPELNSQHVRKYNAKWPVQLHIQNFADESKLLHDHMCYS